MAYDEKTKLMQILTEHPWLEEELPRRYPQLKAMDNAGSRFMLKRMSVKDASRLSGYSAEKLLAKLESVIAEHEGK